MGKKVLIPCFSWPYPLFRKGKSEIEWVGSSWICDKNRTHYNAFSRKETIISAHSFVLITSEQNKRYLAYIEDMYKDKNGKNKIKVRWFHHNPKFEALIPPPKPHCREIFLTHYTQVISAECVDDVATILTPEDHSWVRSLSSLSPSSTSFFCYREYSKGKFRHFDLRTLKGYYTQPLLLSLSSSLPPTDSTNRRLHASRCVQNRKDNTRPPGPRNQVKPPYSLGQNIEVVSHDIGLRGCWFRCTVLDLSCTKIKVRYDDLVNSDESGNAEEWVRANKYADADKLGMRVENRLTIRPAPSEKDEIFGDGKFVVGRAVDVWRGDGWWEGVVIESDDTDEYNEDDFYNYYGDDREEDPYKIIKVYFPGEGMCLECERKDIRVSRDWDYRKWVKIEKKPDILALISSFSNRENEEQVESDQTREDCQKNEKKRARDETIEDSLTNREKRARDETVTV